MSVILGRLAQRVMAIEVGAIPAGKGEPEMGVRAPFLGSIVNPDTLFDMELAT
jgi:hypothetical protein